MTSYEQGTQATLTSSWAQYPGGPATDVTDLTITITESMTSTVVVGPTSDDITHPATGLYQYAWQVPVDQEPGDYTVIWDATDADSDAVQASEVVTVVPLTETGMYATLEQLKARLSRTDAVRDDQLTDALVAASRDVDNDTGRRFWLDDAASPRLFGLSGRLVRGRGADLLLIDDVGSAVDLAVEMGSGDTWSTVTGWDTAPDNALPTGRPVTGLVRPGGWWCGPGQRIRVTARWGWPAVPSAISQATLLRAHRLYARRGTPEGVAGFGDQGVVRVGRYDPDYDALIGPYTLPGFGG
ncbi:MAG TPA: hypothetical protein VHF06_37840 [Pseudonocardiaceae bacterium]|nr:hypothetical protein [Pseudonocardiaceae bacterium]